MIFNSNTHNFLIPDGLAGSNPDPRAIAHANPGPIQVIVHNIGPVVIYLAYDAAELINSSGPTAGTFILVPGEKENFNMNDGQKMFAIGTGNNSRISVAISDASLN